MSRPPNKGVSILKWRSNSLLGIAVLLLQGLCSACGVGPHNLSSSGDVDVASGATGVAISGKTFSATFPAAVNVATVTTSSFYVVPTASTT
jgi:hypothetical protein